MNSRIKPDWNKLFAFESENEKAEHEADMLSLKIALVIKDLLEEKGISKKELAQLMNTSAAYITQVLRGDKRINMLFLSKLNRVLNVKLEINFNNGMQSDRELLDEAFNMATNNDIRKYQELGFASNCGFAASSGR